MEIDLEKIIKESDRGYHGQPEAYDHFKHHGHDLEENVPGHGHGHSKKVSKHDQG